MGRLGTIVAVLGIAACGSTPAPDEPAPRLIAHTPPDEHEPVGPEQRVTIRCQPAGGEIRWDGAWHSCGGDGYTFVSLIGPRVLDLRHADAGPFFVEINAASPASEIWYPAASRESPLGKTPMRDIELEGPGPVRLELQNDGY